MTGEVNGTFLRIRLIIYQLLTIVGFVPLRGSRQQTMRNGSIFGGDLGSEWIRVLLFVFCGSGSRHVEFGVMDVYV